jgi:uncharacterized protein Usg
MLTQVSDNGYGLVTGDICGGCDQYFMYDYQKFLNDYLVQSANCIVNYWSLMARTFPTTRSFI